MQLKSEDIITVVQIAPAVRTAWGEDFGMPKEYATAQRLVAGLRRIGFDYIFDTTFCSRHDNYGGGKRVS